MASISRAAWSATSGRTTTTDALSAQSGPRRRTLRVTAGFVSSTIERVFSSDLRRRDACTQSLRVAHRVSLAAAVTGAPTCQPARTSERADAGARERWALTARALHLHPGRLLRLSRRCGGRLVLRAGRGAQLVAALPLVRALRHAAAAVLLGARRERLLQARMRLARRDAAGQKLPAMANAINLAQNQG